MAGHPPNGRSLKAVLWTIASIAGIVTAFVGAQGWADDRYAPMDDHVTRSEFKVTDHRVQRLEEDLREIRSDTKEILRRLPK